MQITDIKYLGSFLTLTKQLVLFFTLVALYTQVGKNKKKKREVKKKKKKKENVCSGLT